MEDYFISIVLLLIIIFIILFIPGSCLYNKGYKKGQIDYANGKIKYELRQNENEEMRWEKIFKQE